MKKHVVALLLAGASCASMAAWVRVAEDSEAVRYYDPTTVQRTVNVVTLWELSDFKRVATTATDHMFRSAKRQTQYDCVGARGRVISQLAFEGQMADGRALDPKQVDGGWEAVDPASAGAALLAQACSN